MKEINKLSRSILLVDDNTFEQAKTYLGTPDTGFIRVETLKGSDIIMLKGLSPGTILVCRLEYNINIPDDISINGMMKLL